MTSQTVTFGDLVNQTNDWLQNYSVTTIDPGNIQRGCNRAIEYMQRRLGLPSDRKIQSFNFYEDVNFYDLVGDTNEVLQIYYNATSANVQSDNNYFKNRWFLYKDMDMMRDSATIRSQNRASMTTANGKLQLMMIGKNIHGSNLLNTFDSLTGLTYSSDVASASIDNTIYLQGAGSFKFNINSGLSTTTVTTTGQWDMSNNFNQNAAIRLGVFFPTGSGLTAFTDAEIWLQSSTGNYYKITTTLQYDGTAWITNAWSKLSFPLSSAQTVGSPNSRAITSIIITLPHAGGFAPITNMRFDNMYMVNPDLINVMYYTSIKGTDTTGVTSKIILDQNSDILAFGAYAPDLILPISLKAAVYLWPQLRADINFQGIYKTEFDDSLKLFGKSYPRARAVSAGSTQLVR